MIFMLFKTIVRVIFSLCYRLRTYGTEENFIPGPAIVASNHTSFLDPIVIPLSVRGKIYHLARSTLFSSSFSKWLFTQCACYPVNRNAGNSAAFKAALELFRRREKLIIYPEGMRNTDGEMQTGKVGVGMLAIKGKVPVIPVYVAGTHEAFGRHQKFPKIWRTITTVFGTPVTFDDLIQNESISRKEAYQLATDRIMECISELKRWHDGGCIGNVP